MALQANAPLVPRKEENFGDFDALIIVTLTANQKHLGDSPVYGQYLKQIDDYKKFDESVENDGCLLVLPDGHPVKRLIYSPVGPVFRDYDDVRRFRDAAYRGVKRALKAGASKPVISIPTGDFSKHFPLFDIVTVLGAYEALYTPIEIRETLPSKTQKMKHIAFNNFTDSKRQQEVYRLAEAIETGRNVARDIGGSDPERMSAPNVADYVKSVFANTCIKVEVMGRAEIKKEFPCLHAVDRASAKQHEARAIFLTYEPQDGSPVDTTLVLVGKGVTYDTGGHDVKAGGIMAGMHRDKCGSAAVAGFFQTLAALKPKGIRVLGAMAMVRNSIGPDGYVADEIITSRAGIRVRIGNTDAEGRMAMVDVLCYLKEKVLKEKHPNPFFFTVATLTGHACLAFGDFSAIMDNGPAKAKGVSKKIQEAGEQIGDLFEISTLRREDYDFNKGKSEYEDILQCNNLPSSRTPRGHQIPGAFLVQVSGLDKHGIDSDIPLPFSHIDIAASSGPFPGVPSGAPIPALAVTYLFGR